MEEKPSKEKLIDDISEIMRVGLTIVDAMHKVAGRHGYADLVHANDLDWRIETTKNPQKIITITLVE